MTLSSMTGFARVEGHRRDLSWAWEVKSVNARGLEIRCRLPPGFESLEPQIRALAQARFRRGSLNVSLETRRATNAETITVNEAVLAKLAAVAAKLRRKHRLGASSPEGLLALRGVLEVTEGADDSKAAPVRHKALFAALNKAFADLVSMRQAEGEKLRLIVLTQIARIESLATAARQSPARAPDLVRKRLLAQIERLFETGPNFDTGRLHQEAVLLATKSDIEEELDRTFAHIAAARILLENLEPVGRRLDFLAQEFSREANTLCAKAIDYSLTEIGLELKAVIDQMREQVQNLE